MCDGDRAFKSLVLVAFALARPWQLILAVPRTSDACGRPCGSAKPRSSTKSKSSKVHSRVGGIMLKGCVVSPSYKSLGNYRKLSGSSSRFSQESCSAARSSKACPEYFHVPNQMPCRSLQKPDIAQCYIPRSAPQQFSFSRHKSQQDVSFRNRACSSSLSPRESFIL